MEPTTIKKTMRVKYVYKTTGIETY